MTQYKGTNKTNMTSLYAQLSEANEKITILFLADDGEGSGAMNIYLKKFNEVTKKYEDDLEVKEKAVELLEQLGTTLETVEEDMSQEKSFDLYFDGERVSTKPINTFIKYDKITTRDGKSLAKSPQEVQLTLASNYKGLRFDLGFEFPTVVNGEETVNSYRISQVLIPNPDPDQDDSYVTLKYQTKKMESFREQIKMFDEDKSNLPESVIEQIKKLYELDVEKQKNIKSDEFKGLFGIDLNAWVENPELYVVDAEVSAKTLQGNDGTVYFLVAEIKDVHKSE